MVPREKPDNAVSRESSSTSHVVSQYDIPEENIYIYTHPLVIKHAGLDGKIIELHGGFSSKPRLSTRGYQNMGSLFPPTDKHVYIYIYVTYLDIPCNMISYMITHVISYHMQVKYMHTIRTWIALHCIIYCALHYSTLQYITLQYIAYIHNYILDGGFNPSEKY